MRKFTYFIFACFFLTISYAQEKQDKSIKFLENNIHKFNLVNDAVYQAGYSMTYKYEYKIEDGVFTETDTYVKTQQKAIFTANLKDLIKVEEDTQEGKHESLLLTFKTDAVSFVTGNFKEKRNTIYIQLCTKSVQDANFKLQCKKAIYALKDAFPNEVTKALEGVIKKYARD